VTEPERAALRRNLLQMLAARRSRDYRWGLIQFAVIAEVVTHQQWSRLYDLIRAGVRPITNDHLHGEQSPKEPL
jgi:hypothetical protein